MCVCVCVCVYSTHFIIHAETCANTIWFFRGLEIDIICIDRWKLKQEKREVIIQ